MLYQYRNEGTGGGGETAWTMPVLSADTQTVNGITYVTSADSSLNANMLPHMTFNGINADTLATQGQSWHSAKATTQGTHWIMLATSQPVKVGSITIHHRYTALTIENHNIKDFVFEGSNDGLTWTELIADTCAGVPATAEIFTAVSPGYYGYYRLRITTTYSVNAYEIYAVIGELNLSGYSGGGINSDTIPSMTSDIYQDAFSQTWQAMASTFYDASYAAYKAFDGQATTQWANGYEEGSTTIRELISWLGIKMPSPKKVIGYTLSGFSYEAYPATWIFQGSDDGTSWIDIDTRSVGTELAGKEKTYYLAGVAKHQYYRVYITVYGKYLIIPKFQVIEVY